MPALLSFRDKLKPKIMITDAQTNFVYFSELLHTNPKYTAFCKNLTSILDKHNIGYGFLPDTNDIWCRDYMPVQVAENKFIEYRYDPDYLQELKYRRTKTYPDLVCDKLGIKTVKTDIILDGGNVIKWENKVILTDKIIPENASKYLKAQLIEKLKALFEVDTIILIPRFIKNGKTDLFGHADGMIRFIDADRVLVDGYYKTMKPGYGDKFYKVLKANKLIPVEFEFMVNNRKQNNWAYLNFLQMKDLIVFPQFGIDSDQAALEKIKTAFPEYASKGQIETIDASAIIRDGGVLNCITWTIKTNIA
jgi:agmatine/peptidylarginine deiminase